jgi:hypothetical protein
VKQRFTYSGFPGCRAARHPGCNAHDSASFAHGPVNATCSVARATHRSLAPHSWFTLTWRSVSIESTLSCRQLSDTDSDNFMTSLVTSECNCRSSYCFGSEFTRQKQSVEYALRGTDKWSECRVNHQLSRRPTQPRPVQEHSNRSTRKAKNSQQLGRLPHQAAQICDHEVDHFGKVRSDVKKV